MRTAILFLILIFLIDMVFGLGFRFYRILYFDMILHFLGGFFVAMFFYDYLKEYMNPVRGSKIKKLLIITGTTVFIGLIWEFSEHIATAIQATIFIIHMESSAVWAILMTLSMTWQWILSVLLLL